MEGNVKHAGGTKEYGKALFSVRRDGLEQDG